MNFIKFLKDYQLANNSLYDFFWALIILLGALIILKIIKSVIIVRLKKVSQKTKTKIDDLLIKIIEDLGTPLYFFAGLYLAIQTLSFSNWINNVIFGLFIFFAIMEAIKGLEKIIDYLVELKTSSESESGEDVHQRKLMIYGIRLAAKIVIWSFGIVLLLSNLGINITSLVAGLGIGGIAVALAIQNILGDLFNSFSIYFDKPFKVGDFIVVGGDMGTVEKIGLKTTRLRTLVGEELVISNTELTKARIQNFKRLQKRRVIFKIGVVYGTPLEKLKKIPNLIKQAVETNEKLTFDRCNFVQYGDFSLIYETVYYIASADYNEHVVNQENIFLSIYEKFEAEKIEFAYPTQTVVLQK